MAALRNKLTIGTLLILNALPALGDQPQATEGGEHFTLPDSAWVSLAEPSHGAPRGQSCVIWKGHEVLVLAANKDGKDLMLEYGGGKQESKFDCPQGAHFMMPVAARTASSYGTLPPPDALNARPPGPPNKMPEGASGPIVLQLVLGEYSVRPGASLNSFYPIEHKTLQEQSLAWTKKTFGQAELSRFTSSLKNIDGARVEPLLKNLDIAMMGVDARDAVKELSAKYGIQALLIRLSFNFYPDQVEPSVQIIDPTAERVLATISPAPIGPDWDPRKIATYLNEVLKQGSSTSPSFFKNLGYAEKADAAPKDAAQTNKKGPWYKFGFGGK